MILSILYILNKYLSSCCHHYNTNLYSNKIKEFQITSFYLIFIAFYLLVNRSLDAGINKICNSYIIKLDHCDYLLVRNEC